MGLAQVRPPQGQPQLLGRRAAHLRPLHPHLHQRRHDGLSDLKLGNIDAAVDVPFAEFRSLSSTPGIKTSKAASWQFSELAFNCYASPDSKGNPVLRDPVFRQALNYAIDRNKIVATAFNGYAQPGSSLIVPYSPFHWQPPASDTFTYDPAKANQMLDRRGLQDGQRRLPHDQAGQAADAAPDGHDRLAGQRGRRQARRAVVQGRGREGDPVDRRSRRADQRPVPVQRQHLHAQLGHVHVVLDPGRRPGLHGEHLHARQSTGYGWNDCLWTDPAYTKLSNEAATTIDQSKRIPLVQQAEKIFYDSAPYAIMAYPYQLEAWNTNKWSGWTQAPSVVGSAIYNYNNIDTYTEPGAQGQRQELRRRARRPDRGDRRGRRRGRRPARVLPAARPLAGSRVVTGAAPTAGGAAYRRPARVRPGRARSAGPRSDRPVRRRGLPAAYAPAGGRPSDDLERRALVEPPPAWPPPAPDDPASGRRPARRVRPRPRLTSRAIAWRTGTSRVLRRTQRPAITGPDGRPAAYAWVFDSADHAAVDGQLLVAPEHQWRGLEAPLLDWIERFAGELGGRRPRPAAAYSLGVWCGRGDRRGELYRRAGFAHVRAFRRLRMASTTCPTTRSPMRRRPASRSAASYAAATSAPPGRRSQEAFAEHFRLQLPALRGVAGAGVHRRRRPRPVVSRLGRRPDGRTAYLLPGALRRLCRPTSRVRRPWRRRGLGQAAAAHRLCGPARTRLRRGGPGRRRRQRRPARSASTSASACAKRRSTTSTRRPCATAPEAPPPGLAGRGGAARGLAAHGGRAHGGRVGSPP